jgi:predicted TIM-barrel fold metal-dependent hydrolase
MSEIESTSNTNGEILISADSHVIEPPNILKERVPRAYRDQAPEFPKLKVGQGFQAQPGGSDPNERLKEMETDGVSAEVLYPTHLLPHFGMDDAKLQEICFRAYNDWLIEYIQVAPSRLVGIAAISVYDIDAAVRELERCARAGMKGSIIWQAPHADLPFSSPHYDRFWSASQDLNMVVNLHILTGHGYHKDPDFYKSQGIENYRASVNLKLKEITDALFDLIFFGILERYPRLKFLSVENEVGWMPFMLQQWDYYYRRFRSVNPPPISTDPSEYFKRQIFGTFFRDEVGGHALEWWGQDNCMWSNDYPHGNSTWPNSRRFIERNLGHLPADVKRKLLCTNVAKLFQIDIPQTAVAA